MAMQMAHNFYQERPQLTVIVEMPSAVAAKAALWMREAGDDYDSDPLFVGQQEDGDGE